MLQPEQWFLPNLVILVSIAHHHQIDWLLVVMLVLLGDLSVVGSGKSITGQKIAKVGGSSTEFLKADGKC